ncbi:LOW QUALITY PROTEIN: protocadherin-7-like, partial [Ruditapes philippinarum]|uniref:LOW QUALITY PROTEIN: protocadherin-7-like n=1 Tax=Ruditapes philippinarum TaxID=129788 RepID=UPI00295BE20A
FEIISVKVVINDLNDNSPTFPHNTQAIAISEAAAKGSSYMIENAVDHDKGANNSIQYYEFVGDKNVFDLRVERKLDESFSVKLLVIYKMKSPFLLQHFLYVTVKEDTRDGSGILQISATDKDINENSWLLYRLSPRQSDLEEIKSLFYINEHTGVLSIIGQLVYDPKKVYKIIVEAVDRGKPSLPSTNQAEVTVYIKDTGNNPPTVQINLISSGTGRMVNVSEFSSKGTFVAHVEVKDKDTGQNGDVSCSVDDAFFALEPLSNKGYKVVVAKTLDSEKQDLHTVVVTCEDKGSPVLSSSDSFLVRVTDENDMVPKFTKKNYFEDFYENNERGDLVISVRATDDDKSNTNNSKIEYYLDPMMKDYFTIDSSTGTIRALVPFDREERSIWTFKVFARDFGNPRLTGNATVNVRIKDENDNAPKFTNTTFIFYVQENLPSGSVADRLTAKDYDADENGMFTYAISNTKETKLPFLLFPDGVIKTTMELDREAKSSYEFLVIAIDKGIPKRTSSAKVIIKVSDVNDESRKIVFPKKKTSMTLLLCNNTPVSSGPNTNIIIVVVVIFLTFFLSLAIIIVICVIRKFDRDRLKTQNIQINKLPNNMTEIRDNTANGVIMTRPYDKVDSLKKRKEVSFSFEDDLDCMQDHELTFSNNSAFNEPVTEVTPLYSFKPFVKAKQNYMIPCER